MRKRWRQFRRNRRAWRSLLALSAIFAVSLCAELICNDRPLALRLNGRLFFPFLRRCSQDELLGNGVAAPPDYAALRASPAFASAAGNFMLFAPVPFGPHTVVDPATLERHRRVVLGIKPGTAIGRLNLTAEGIVVRAVGCAPFFPGAEEIDGLVFTNYWRLAPELAAALEARFANRPAPPLAVTLEAVPRPPPPPAAATTAAPPARLLVSLAAYEPRPLPPRSARLALRDPAAPPAMPTTLRFGLRGGTLRPLSRRPWKSLPAEARTSLSAIAAGIFATREPQETVLPPLGRVTGMLEPVAWPHRPVPGHWMGIDSAGRDVLARVLYGTRTALIFGLLLVGWATLLGFVIGAVQGYFGGWLDLLAQRLIEIWSALPFLYVMILLGAVLGRSFGLLLLCYGLFNWIGLSSYMRAEFLRLRQRPFVEAARCQGLGAARIIRRHILPNALTPLVTLTPFNLVGAIASITALDYLGFGLPPLTPSWGELLQQAQQERAAWWLILHPAAMLFTVMLLTVLIGEGLRDAFDPKPRSRYR